MDTQGDLIRISQLGQYGWEIMYDQTYLNELDKQQANLPSASWA